MNRKNHIKLIAFDLDGVLVDGRGCWKEVHQGLGTSKQSESHAEKYHSNQITFDEWARKDAELWRGIDIAQIKEILYQARLMEGTPETITELKNKGYKLAIISGGLKILADKLKEDFGFDHAIANELLVENGKVCGMKQIVDMKSKGKALRKIAQEEGIKREKCAAVGDFINDIPMFEWVNFSVAFNPKKPEVEETADVVIHEKNLSKVLEFF